MKNRRLSAELNWIKRLQTPYPHCLNDQTYQQGNISSIRSNINIFSLKPSFPPQTQFIKIMFISQGLDLLNISNILEITESLLKSRSISRILTLLLFVISTTKLLETLFLTITKLHLILMF